MDPMLSVSLYSEAMVPFRPFLKPSEPPLFNGNWHGIKDNVKEDSNGLREKCTQSLVSNMEAIEREVQEIFKRTTQIEENAQPILKPLLTHVGNLRSNTEVYMRFLHGEIVQYKNIPFEQILKLKPTLSLFYEGDIERIRAASSSAFSMNLGIIHSSLADLSQREATFLNEAKKAKLLPLPASTPTSEFPSSKEGTQEPPKSGKIGWKLVALFIVGLNVIGMLGYSYWKEELLWKTAFVVPAILLTVCAVAGKILYSQLGRRGKALRT